MNKGTFRFGFREGQIVEFEDDASKSLHSLKERARGIFATRHNLGFGANLPILAMYAKFFNQNTFSRVVHSASIAKEHGCQGWLEKNPVMLLSWYKPRIPTRSYDSRFTITGPMAPKELYMSTLVLKDTTEVRFHGVEKNSCRYIKLEFASTTAPVYYLISNFTSMIRAMNKILKVLSVPLAFGCVKLSHSELEELHEWATKQSS